MRASHGLTWDELSPSIGRRRFSVGSGVFWLNLASLLFVSSPRVLCGFMQSNELRCCSVRACIFTPKGHCMPHRSRGGRQPCALTANVGPRKRVCAVGTPERPPVMLCVRRRGTWASSQAHMYARQNKSCPWKEKTRQSVLLLHRSTYIVGLGWISVTVFGENIGLLVVFL